MRSSVLDAVSIAATIAIFICAGWFIASALFEYFMEVVAPVFGHVLDRNSVL